MDITSSTLELTAENLQYITLDQYSGIHYPRLYQKTKLKERKKNYSRDINSTIFILKMFEFTVYY